MYYVLMQNIIYLHSSKQDWEKKPDPFRKFNYDRPTDQQTYIRGHREVTLQIKVCFSWSPKSNDNKQTSNEKERTRNYKGRQNHTYIVHTYTYKRNVTPSWVRYYYSYTLLSGRREKKKSLEKSFVLVKAQVNSLDPFHGRKEAGRRHSDLRFQTKIVIKYFVQSR